MRISDWSSDVCSSDLDGHAPRSGKDRAAPAARDGRVADDNDLWRPPESRRSDRQRCRDRRGVGRPHARRPGSGDKKLAGDDKVALVGAGVTDAPSMAIATLDIAMGAAEQGCAAGGGEVVR